LEHVCRQLWTALQSLQCSYGDGIELPGIKNDEELLRHGALTECHLSTKGCILCSTKPVGGLRS